MRKRVCGLLVVAVVCAVGAASLLVANATTGALQKSPTDVSRSVATKYIAALTSAKASRVAAIFAPKGVEVDKAAGAGGATIQGAHDIASAWSTEVFGIPGYRFHGTLTCAAADWAVVNWVMQTNNSIYQGGKVRTTGISILEITSGKIARETLYYERIDTR